MRHPLFCCATFVALLFLFIFCSPVKADFNGWNAFSFEISPDKSPEERLGEFLERFSGETESVDFSSISGEKASWIEPYEESGVMAITPMEVGVYAIQLLIEKPKDTVPETLGISFSSNTSTPYLININGSELHLDISGAPLPNQKFEEKDIPAGDTEDEVTKYFVTFFVLNPLGDELRIFANVEMINVSIDEKNDATGDNGTTGSGGNSLGGQRPPLTNPASVVTPEPVTCLIVGAGLLAAGWGLRRKKHTK